jgi:Predicted membrane protein (DUF2232)
MSSGMRLGRGTHPVSNRDTAGQLRKMPYTLLIGLGAGFVSAVVFASATTGPLIMRLILFVLTSLPLFLAGLGIGPVTAAVAGATGVVLVFAAGSGTAASVFAVSQAIPVFLLTYLALLNRSDGETTEWYPVGRIVLAAAFLAGLFATFTLLLLGGDIEALRETLRGMLEKFVATELPKMPDAPTLGPKEIDEATAVALMLLPAASAISTMGSLLFNMWLAGRITLASGRLRRPWPDLAAMVYPTGTPLLLAVAITAGLMSGLPGLIAAGFAGPLFFAYVLMGLAVVHFVSRGRSWRPFLLWALYAALFIMNTVASLAVALLGLTESIWPIRKKDGGDPPPPTS